MHPGSDDIVFGLTSHGRPEVTDGDKLLGSFVSSVPFRLTRKGKLSGKALLAQIQEKDTKLKAHERLSLYRIKKLVAGREEWRDSLFNVLFNFVDLPDVNEAESLSANPIAIGPIFIYGQAGTENLIDFTVELGANPRILISAPKHLYSEDELSRLSTYFGRILKELSSSSEANLTSESLLSLVEKEAILKAGQGEQLPAESIVDFCHRFAEVAANQPEGIALLNGEEQYTFKELDEWSNQIAHRLLENGAKPGKVVGLLLDRSAAMLTSIIGILKSGSGYLPIDPKWPTSRVSLVLDDGGIELLGFSAGLSANIDFVGTVFDPAAKKLAESPKLRSKSTFLHPIPLI